MEAVRPIRSDADYDWALRQIEPYFENPPVPGTPEADRFDVLAALIEAHEARVWPIESADAIDAIATMIETGVHSRKELETILGSRSRASEVLARKRRLTMRMAYDLHKAWRIPAEVLPKPYHLDRA